MEGAITSRPAARNPAADSTGDIESRVAAFLSALDHWIALDRGHAAACTKATYAADRPPMPSMLYWRAFVTAVLHAAAGAMPVRLRVVMEVLGQLAEIFEQYSGEAGWQSSHVGSSFWRVRDSLLSAHARLHDQTVATLADEALDEDGDARLKAVAGRLAKSRADFGRV